MKIAYVDIETTGLFHDKHGIHQIAVLVTDVEKYLNEGNMASLVLDCNILPGRWIDDKALEVSGKTKEQIEKAMPATEAKVEFTRFLDRFVDKFDKKDKLMFAAYNASFDNQFLRTWFTLQGDRFFGSYFWWPSLDIMTLAAFHLAERRHTLEDFKQGTVAKALGIEIEEEKLHDALYDIRLTKAIHDSLVEKFNTTEQRRQSNV